MEEALHNGDFILVKKLAGFNMPQRGDVVLFNSPLEQDSLRSPIFISRCIGMPGDTIHVNSDGYTINGTKIPRSPRSLSSYFISIGIKNSFMAAMKRLHIPTRNFENSEFGFMLSLTSFEEYQLRAELTEKANKQFVAEKIEEYMLIVPRKDVPHPLNTDALTACKEIIKHEAGDIASFRDEKLYLDGREANFFFFKQDYYWMLSDNTNEAIDSRHLGFIPADHIIGKAWIRWFGIDKKQLFKTIY